MTRARVYEVDGKLVLDDPDACAMVAAVSKHNCKLTLHHQADRVDHFKARVRELGYDPASTAIVVLNVDDKLGGILAHLLMPDGAALWEAARARGETPFARGFVFREPGFLPGLRLADPDAAAKLEAITGQAVVVMDHGVVEVFEV